MTEGEQLALAFHEAGHAIAAMWFGRKIVSVGLHVCNTYGLVATDELTTKQLMQITLAGPLAHYRHAPRLFRRWHARIDDEKAERLARKICASDASVAKYLAWLRVETRTLVEGPMWPSIEFLAPVILHCVTVDGVVHEDIPFIFPAGSFDRIEAARLLRGVKAEEYSYERREEERKRDRIRLNRNGPVSKTRHCILNTQSE